MLVKALLLGFAVGCAVALPTDIFKQENKDLTRNAVENLLLDLLEEGREIILKGNDDVPVLDPFHYEEIRADFADIVIPDVNLAGHLNIDNLLVNNLATFEVRNLNFGILTRRLDFELYIPVLEVLADEYDLLAIIDGVTVPGKGAASIHILNIRAEGFARITPSIISGLQVQDCRLSVHVGEFQPNLEGLLGDGYTSVFVNNVLGHLVPDLVESFEPEITQFLSEHMMVMVNDILRNL